MQILSFASTLLMLLFAPYVLQTNTAVAEDLKQVIDFAQRLIPYHNHCTIICFTCVRSLQKCQPLGEDMRPHLLNLEMPKLRGSVFPVRYSLQCSIVYYLESSHSGMEHFDQNWLRHIPGGVFLSFHFLKESRQPTIDFWNSPDLRKMHNVVIFVEDGNGTGKVLSPNRFRGKPLYFAIGEILGNEVFLNSPSETVSAFWNRWRDLQGEPLTLVVPDTQADLVYTDKSAKMTNYAATQIQETSRFLNATLKVITASTGNRFGRKLPNGTWDGFIGKLIDDTVDLAFPFFPSVEQYKAVLFSKTATFAQVKFFAPLPRVRPMTIAFLTKPFDRIMWMGIFCCIVLLTACSCAFRRLHKMYVGTEIGSLRPARHFVLFLRALVDQSLPDGAYNIMTAVAGIRTLLGYWLYFAMVISSLYKSVIVSVLVNPVLENPPSTADELRKSDYHINVVMHKSLMKETIPWAKEGNHSITDYGVDLKGCLKSLLSGRNVCLFVYQWLHLHSSYDLIDQCGRELFLPSKDLLTVSDFYGISERNPQLKSAIELIVDVTNEGGVSGHWFRMVIHQRTIKSLRGKRNNSPCSCSKKNRIDRKLLQYPFLLVSAGVLGGGIVCALEVVLHRYLFGSRMDANCCPLTRQVRKYDTA